MYIKKSLYQDIIYTKMNLLLLLSDLSVLSVPKQTQKSNLAQVEMMIVKDDKLAE